MSGKYESKLLHDLALFLDDDYGIGEYFISGNFWDIAEDKFLRKKKFR